MAEADRLKAGVMKVRASVKKICDKCKVIHRKGVVRVICVNSNINSARDRNFGVSRESLTDAADAQLILAAFALSLRELMARIAGVDLPRQKHIYIALTYIYGIGVRRAGAFWTRPKLTPTKKVQDLSEEEVNRIRQVIESRGMVEGDLRKEVSMNIKRLIEIGSYRGFRHRRNLPVRGQRTHTNARTRKGPRKGTVAQKKKASAKT